VAQRSRAHPGPLRTIHWTRTAPAWPNLLGVPRTALSTIRTAGGDRCGAVLRGTALDSKLRLLHGIGALTALAPSWASLSCFRPNRGTAPSTAPETRLGRSECRKHGVCLSSILGLRIKRSGG